MKTTPIKIPVALVLLWAATAAADRGLVPLRPEVQVFEPVQQALVAWNGREELLLLTTDVHASTEVEVLEFLPLPSEPKVSEGDRDLLRRAISLINQRLAESPQFRRGYEGKGRGAGVVTFQGRIGIHDVTVSRVLDADGFVRWVERALGEDMPRGFTLPEPVKDGVARYLTDGFEWFVFDMIRASEEAASTDALQYRFATERLYYPLRATSTASGRSRIRLLILTPMLLRDFTGWPAESVKLMHPPVRLTSWDLEHLGGGLPEFFQTAENLHLRIWEIEADLSDFDRDLLAR
jgi:hypothetical protein